MGKKKRTSGEKSGGLSLDRLKKVAPKHLDRQQLALGAAAIAGGIGLIAIGLKLRDRAGRGGGGDSAGAIDRELGLPSESAGETGGAFEADEASDLALDRPRPGADDRAPSAFRPDPTAAVPDDTRDAFAPATTPTPNRVTPAM